MKKFSITLIILLFAGFFMQGAPAKKGQLTLYQPNGYTFFATLQGDEFAHVLTTASGNAIVQDEDGYYSYAWFDADGNRYSSGVHVGEDAQSDVLVQSIQIPYSIFRQNALEARWERDFNNSQEPILRRIFNKVHGSALSSGPITKAEEGEVTTKRGLVLLVEFKDVSYTYTKSDFVAMLTQSGYNVNGATGSAKEYFDDQFQGLWEFDFTVSSIITLSHSRSYYGGNDKSGNDSNPAQMVYDACKLADDEIDFSLFDEDGDGEVDNVFVFYAGGDEAEGDDDDCIWSHSWTLKSGTGSTLTLDGVQVNTYACTSEKTLLSVTHSGKTYQIKGIGTFCHEYSHTLGLSDYYDTDYDTPTGAAIAAGMWYSTALMDGGNYNNDGMTPPYMNAVDRDCLGISEALELTEGTFTLAPINQSGEYYRLDTDVEDEYYLFECRASSGWDTYINDGNEAGGLMIYHVDKSSSRQIYSATYGRNTSPANRWNFYNEVNANPAHQCADLIEADGRTDQIYNETLLRTMDKAGLFYPAGGNAFTSETTPSFSFWSGALSDLSIVDIEMDGDNVVFTVLSSEDVATPVATDIVADVYQDAAIISWCNDQLSSRKSYFQVQGESEVHEVTAHADTAYTYVMEYLTPGEAYLVDIWFESYGSDKAEKVTYAFVTEDIDEGAYPYIYFPTPALSTGYFASGTQIPLRVRNCVDPVSIVWTLASAKIYAGDDGYYTLTSGGTLKATITYSDGTTEVVRRQITISK